jgi:hypothetical protein
LSARTISVIKTVINWQLSCKYFRNCFDASYLGRALSFDNSLQGCYQPLSPHPKEALLGVIKLLSRYYRPVIKSPLPWGYQAIAITVQNDRR